MQRATVLKGDGFVLNANMIFAINAWLQYMTLTIAKEDISLCFMKVTRPKTPIIDKNVHPAIDN
jgi:hypothetical protein